MLPQVTLSPELVYLSLSLNHSEEYKNFLINFTTSKLELFYVDGIRNHLDHWPNIIYSQGK